MTASWHVVAKLLTVSRISWYILVVSHTQYVVDPSK